ncbi:sigma-70 family RNA polymerase sigma factor [Candidatus Poribacteria bacterium]|nr:sigma-70 family RNA polymerase sigma factor [Candidatus Poribacteria bacterium]MYH79802.1 sigma-70 family RNA polymerase sigma factor [Candidatus Poribacteria bacterium]MYK96513.1 sigma-70 family RNA polymerase sigma factor [Candidatus Poribacteria bacterium]
MKNDDVQLIQRVLDGDDTAFSALVKKYQRSVHALAWRKIGDFHIAEDITQETFLKAYQRLSTLKEPQSFASWLYVITANHCKAWLRKKRTWIQSLEDTSSAQLERATYSGHIIAENEQMTEEAQREVVKKLLEKLQESDRTVITLYYLGGMTYEEISNFLGVSVGAIKSRLHRARQRLKKEEPMIREALGNFQITPHLTENIMREISRLKPVALSGNKPLVPWAIGVSTLAVVFLILGVGTEYLSRFQKPYSFDATSEMTIDIIETPIVLDLESKPDVRTQLGSTAAPSENDGASQQPDEVLFAAAQTDGEDVSIPKQQWIQAGPIKGSRAKGLLATFEGELYTFADMQVYKLGVDGKEGRHIFDFRPLVNSRPPAAPLAKWKDTLYIMLANELLASKDDGQTWDLVHTLPDVHYDAIGLILTEQAFYAAFENGIFRSEDNGETWQAINDGLMMGDIGYIRSIVNIQDTLFVGTRDGFYRLSADSWQRVAFPVSIGRIRSVAATEEKLYVAAELSDADPRAVSRGQQQAWGIFRSTDLGNSWTDITPTNAWPPKGRPPFVKLIAAGDTLLAMEQGMVRSTDSGNTWLPPQLPGASPTMNADVNKAIVINENVFYAGSGGDGLHRSTDAGKSWDIVNITPDTGQIGNLIAHREDNMPLTLYARYEEQKVVKTIDRGASWKGVEIKIPMTALRRERTPSITHIVKADGKIYAKGGASLGKGKTHLYRVSTDDNSLVPIQGMPIFDAMELTFESSRIRRMRRDGSNLSDASVIEQLQEKYPGAVEFFRQLVKSDPRQPDIYTQLGFRKGAFAVSGDTFYMEYNYKLFRWEPGDTEWYDTEQEETVELTPQLAFTKLKIAASGNTVYVGKRDGHLVVSFDKGNNWLDLTPALPFPVKAFNDIVSADSTVYVATDAGIITSDGGRHWHIVTDAEGNNLIMEHLAVDGTTLYGVSKTGVYQLENGTWKEVASEVPERVTSFAVDGNVVYVGTQGSGVLHFNLDE